MASSANNEINFLENKLEPLPKAKRKFPLWLKITLSFFGLLLIASTAFAYEIFFVPQNKAAANKLSFLTQIKYLITNTDKPLKGQLEDRINILLIGMGGEGHPGAYLADTIILASFKPSTKELALLSIPRDLYVSIPEYGWRKINNANAFGYEMKYPGAGEALTAKIVSDITNQPIHYYGRVDFEGFRKIIDELGGVEVNVAESFTDYQFPDYNYGYQTVSFKAGSQKMNGEKALQYARSRHASGDQGSDFARSKRQQAVLLALKNKIFSFGTLINPGKLVQVMNILGDHSKTNLEAWEIIQLANLGKEVKAQEIVNRVLDNSAGGALVSATTIDGAYILKPRTGNWSGVQDIAQNIFTAGLVKEEDAKIEIQNGTASTGLAEKISQSLKNQDYNVVKLGNAQRRDYEKTVIYDLTSGQKPNTLKSLKEKLKANVTTTLPFFLTNNGAPNFKNLESDSNLNLGGLNSSAKNSDNRQKIDFLIVLGQNSLADAKLTSSIKKINYSSHSL